MTFDNEIEDDDARTHAVVLMPLSDDLWGACDPDVVAAALAAQLQRVLEFVVTMDGTRAPWACALLARMQVAVLAASDTAAAPRH